MNITQLNLGPLGTNCYIVSDKKTALIIDPGGDAKDVIAYLTNNDIKPLAILLTHAHFDHIGAVDELRSYYEIEVYVHETEAKWLVDAQLNGSSLFIGMPIITELPEQLIEPGKLCIGDFVMDVIHTPGHSPGSVSFVFQKDEIVISGDALFNGGIGRTDLPGGDFSVLAQSIKTKLYALPDHYRVYPGHGPWTTIEREKGTNPFVHA
ncbi:MBL fold metallo-hydrolase [Lentibacillus saliphilus]|uniref:MBL fold metallo-hydrolase n=1 Tax=Lentibacillus saliphilus TaxID=2737028 RepID=UPI001C30C60E|nr:MBL fold metallo-hydrolase [Lentibacillus saliphilus]